MVLYYREYKPTCIERNYGSLIPKHLKAKCFIPYNSPREDDNLQVDTYHPAPNVLMNLAMTKDPHRLCKPCCDRIEQERLKNIKTITCCGARSDLPDCCRPCPDSDTSIGSNSPSKKGSRMSLKSKSAITSDSLHSLVGKRNKKSKSRQTTANPVMEYPYHPFYGPAMYGQAMYGPGGPYIMPVIAPVSTHSARQSISEQSDTNLRPPTLPYSKIIGLVNYDKNHPFCGPYITTPGGKKIYSQRRENERGTAYIWPQQILNELVINAEGKKDVSVYANLVEYDKDVTLEDETSSSEQTSDDSSSLKSKPLFQPPTPDKSIKKTRNVERNVTDNRPTFKNTLPLTYNMELLRTDSNEINYHFIQDYVIPSNDDLSRSTRSSSEWIDNEAGEVLDNQSIGVQCSEVEALEDRSSFKVDRKISTSSLVRSQPVYGTSTFDSNSKSIQVGCQTTSEVGTSPNPIPLKINSIVQADLREVAMMDLAQSSPLEDKDAFLEYNSSLSTHHSVSKRLRYLSRSPRPMDLSSQESHSHTKLAPHSSSSRSGYPVGNKKKHFSTKKLYENRDLRYTESRQNLRVISEQSRNENLDREKSSLSKPKSKTPVNPRKRHHQPNHRDRKLPRPLIKSTSEEAVVRTIYDSPLGRKCECSTRHQTPPDYIETSVQRTTDQSPTKKLMHKSSGKWQVLEDAETDETQEEQLQPICSACKRKDLEERSSPEVQKSSRYKSKKVKSEMSSFLDYQTKHGTHEGHTKKNSFQEGQPSRQFLKEQTHLSSGQNLSENLDHIRRTPPTKFQMPLDESHEKFCRIWREPESKSARMDYHKAAAKSKGKKRCTLAHHRECHTDSLMSNNVLQDRIQTAADRYSCHEKVNLNAPESLTSKKDPKTVNFVLISDSVVESAVQLTEDPSQPSHLTTTPNRSGTSNWRRSDDYSRSQCVLPALPYAMALCPQCEHSENAVPSERFTLNQLPKRKLKKKKRWYFEGIRFAAKK